MDRQIRKLILFFSLAFLALVLNLTYLQILAAEKITTHPQNTRGLLKELKTLRGKILSREGEVLAKNRKSKDNYFRVYPQGELLGNILGFISPRYGRAGLEQTFNPYLLGKKKVATFKDLLSQIKEEKAPGNDLSLTIDLELQKKAAEALGRRKGAIVALNPKTGEVLALVTYPRYNPNLIDKNWSKLSADPESPLLNRGLQGLYPPGSSFKIVTAAGALEKEILTPETVYPGPSTLQVYGGKVTNFADQACGELRFDEALAFSCNTIFAQVGLDLGKENLVKTAQDFGFNQKLSFELPLKISEIPSPSMMDKLEAAWTAVGQGRILVSPFEMALVSAAVANDGVMMRPYLVKEIRDWRGNILTKAKVRPLKRAISEETAQTLSDLLVGVVEEGTGKMAQIPGIKVAGKTGTAEKSKKKKTHAWFVGFAPAENPEVALAVLVEEAGVGGVVAAPIARQVIEAALEP